MKKLICPNCEAERLVEPLEQDKEIEVRGEKFKVHVKLYKCIECNEVIEDPNDPQDELDLAYRAYRTKHGMVQPEEIKAIREMYGLTQKELALLLGWSVATISRYEKGALQDEAHDRILHFLKNPEFLHELLNKYKDRLSAERVKVLSQNIRNKFKNDLITTTLTKLYAPYQDPELTGNTDFSPNKLIKLIVYITQKAVSKINKTKLNKLLFYCDFLHYKHYGKSITGITYVHLPYGPCPENFQTLFSLLADGGLISIKEHMHPDSMIVEEIVNIGEKGKDLKVDFSESELAVVNYVMSALSSKTANELTNISHKEKAYTCTRDGDQINYEFAKYLNLKLEDYNHSANSYFS